MKIVLIDLDKEMIKAWEEKFSQYTDVQIVNVEFGEYMKGHLDEIDAVVSAANSFVLMDGGLDAAYIRTFGKELQNAVQEKLMTEYFGEQPVGSSMIVAIPGYAGKWLIHTPTMRVPQPILDPRIVYSCTRSSLVMALKNDIGTILLPAFGHLTGRIKSSVVASLMEKAYRDVLNRMTDISFNNWQSVQLDHFGGFEDDLREFFG
ncbi:MAG: macro domain-containing protein [Lachnospiraceae bacterium]|nr:macro domain-containing protein [Lachnospiraceae bacterium]